MSYSIISQSLKKSNFNNGYILSHNNFSSYSRNSPYSTLLNNKPNVNKCKLILKTQPLSILSTQQQLNNTNSILFQNLKYQNNELNSIITKRLYSIDDDNNKFTNNNEYNFSYNNEDKKNTSNINSTDKKDEKKETYPWSDSMNNNNNNNSINQSSNEDLWNKKSNELNSNKSYNTSKQQSQNDEIKNKTEETKNDLYELYLALKEKAISYLNSLPSTIDSSSKGCRKMYKKNGKHTKTCSVNDASPFLLWTSFVCASSFSSWFIRQLTCSSLLSTLVMGGITAPAVINFSHLYSQGGKIIAKELGATECSTNSQLYEVVEEIAKKQNLSDVPAVYIHPSEEINALTAGLKNDDSVLLLTKGLLNNLNQEEIKAIITHMLYHQKINFTSLGTHLTSMISGFYTPYNAMRYLRKSLIEFKEKKPNSLMMDIAIGLSSIFVYLTKILTGICYVSQSAFVRYREKEPLPRELMNMSWKSAIQKLYNQPAKTGNQESLITINPSFSHLFLCDGKGEGWEKAASLAGNYENVSKDLQDGNIWKKKKVRTIAEYFSIFPSLKKRIEWTDVDATKEDMKKKE